MAKDYRRLGLLQSSTDKRPYFYLAIYCLLAAPLSRAGADGGTLRVSEVAGRYRITVFTSPADLRAGPIDISVLVQDVNTTDLMPEAKVTVKLIPRDRQDESILEIASHEAATNKMLQAATIMVPRPGWWDVSVGIDGSQGMASIRFPVEIGQPWPSWFAYLPWILWPIVPIGLFAIHVQLVQRRQNAKNRKANKGR